MSQRRRPPSSGARSGHGRAGHSGFRARFERLLQARGAANGRTPNSKSPRNSRAALIGLDVSRMPGRLKTRSIAPAVVAAVVGALFLTVLRIDVIRVRFGLQESLAAELRLEEKKRRLTVEMRELRDPAQLSRRARELGFRRAEYLIDLPVDGVLRPPSEPLEDTRPVELAGRARAERDPLPARSAIARFLEGVEL